MIPIDTAFCFESDTPAGKDPDACSPTLRRYHQFLWSKPLPDGTPFELSTANAGAYLYHRSGKGEFRFSSDSITHTYSRVKLKQVRRIVDQVDASEVERFWGLGYTIGGMVIFPSGRVDGKPTINASRGFNHRIRDRFDLTLECIRRHYQGEESPLGQTLERYADFFRLFGDFRGYVEFFLLQDLADPAFSAISFFLPFDGFKTSPLPSNTEEYLDYMRRNIRFLEARNRRIQRYCSAATPDQLPQR